MKPAEQQADVVVAIRHASLCWRCIAAKAGVTTEEIDEVMLVLQREAAVVLMVAPCDGCQRDTLIYRMRRSSETETIGTL